MACARNRITYMPRLIGPKSVRPSTHFWAAPCVIWDIFLNPFKQSFNWKTSPRNRICKRNFFLLLLFAFSYVNFLHHHPALWNLHLSESFFLIYLIFSKIPHGRLPSQSISLPPLFSFPLCSQFYQHFTSNFCANFLLPKKYIPKF